MTLEVHIDHSGSRKVLFSYVKEIDPTITENEFYNALVGREMFTTKTFAADLVAVIQRERASKERMRLK
jgi:hypothetical protein